MTSTLATRSARRRWDRRRIAYGEWACFLRDALEVLLLAFTSRTVAFALMGSTAIGLSAASVLLRVPRIIDLPRRFDLGLITAMEADRSPKSAHG